MTDKKDIELNSRYWDEFYRTNRGHVPSQFCVSVLTDIDPTSVVIDLGSGNGRDSHYFASRGHIIFAMDISGEAIKRCEEYAVENGSHHSIFAHGDLTNPRDLRLIIEGARSKAGERSIVCYSRFVIHALDDDQERAFLQNLDDLLASGESIYFEFRSKEDANLKKLFGGHYRRYVDTDAFINTLQNEMGFDIDYAITGRGMAKFKQEDPYVSRVVATKR